jgi:hypothetical protein
VVDNAVENSTVVDGEVDSDHYSREVRIDVVDDPEEVQNDDDDEDFARNLSHYDRKRFVSKDDQKFFDKVLESSEVLSVADRLNLSDRDVMMIVVAVAKACNHPIENVTMSYSTIRRRRIQYRRTFVKSNLQECSKKLNEEALVVHWDGKLMKNVTAGES